MAFFSASEWNTKTEQMFAPHGVFKYGAFWAVKDPEPMMRILKAGSKAWHGDAIGILQ